MGQNWMGKWDHMSGEELKAGWYGGRYF